jgi:hypothetical protein
MAQSTNNRLFVCAGSLNCEEEPAYERVTAMGPQIRPSLSEAPSRRGSLTVPLSSYPVATQRRRTALR